MKKIIFLFGLLLAFSQADAQLFDKYKRDLNKVEKQNKEALQDGAGFVLDPIEAVPVQVKTFAANAAQTNWGVNILLPEDLKARLVAAAKYPVYVKIYDTSARTNHAALQAGQQAGNNYTTSKYIDDLQGHGTHVAGIIAADGLGLLDPLVKKGLVQWEGIKILSDSGWGDFQWVANAIAGERAHDLAQLAAGKFVVCNGSFGGGTDIVPVVDEQLKTSTDAGVVFCFASGNTSAAGVNYPGSSPYSITCASLDDNLARSSYSTTGPQVFAAMPGRNINSTYKDNNYAVLSGTSMATPFLTSVTAIAYSVWGDKIKGLAKLKPYLAWCASDLGATGRDEEYGYGIAYVRSILEKDPALMPVLPAPPPPVPVPPTRETRTLTFRMPEQYQIFWSVAGSAAEKETFQPSTFIVAGRGSKKSNTAAGVEAITITALEIATTSNTATAEMYKSTLEKTKWFFTNRGLGLAPGSDYADATYYAAYFLEMLLKTQKGLDTDIVRIEAKDANGNTVIYTGDKLRRWPLVK